LGITSIFVLYLTSDGTGEYYGIAFNATSDVKYKTNIDVIPNALETIKKIEGYQYNWKMRPEAHKEYGVIAQ
jgi:hypothetical protein